MSGNSNTSRPSCYYSTCSSTFANAKAMRKHMEESHKPRKTCPFEGCSTPNYQTKRRSRLLKHFRDVHGLSETDAKEWGRWVENNTPYDDDQGRQGDSQSMAGSVSNAQTIQTLYFNGPENSTNFGSNNAPSNGPVLRSNTGAESTLAGQLNEDDGNLSPEETAEEAAEYEDEDEDCQF